MVAREAWVKLVGVRTKQVSKADKTSEGGTDEGVAREKERGKLNKAK